MRKISRAVGQEGVRVLCMPHVVLGSCMVCAKEYGGEALDVVPLPLRRKLFAICPPCMRTLQELEPGDEAGMWEATCCVCLQAPADVIFLPCGHICVCSICIEQMPRKICPQDRKP